MNLLRRFLLIGLTAGLQAAAVAAPPSCAIPGDVIWWIADDCMSKLETDDEIPASACIEKESDRRFAGPCAAKWHYKRAMCRRSKASGVVESVAGCLTDPSYMGRTVRHKGVGN